MLDNAHIGMVKRFVRQPVVTAIVLSESLGHIQRVMRTSHKLYMRFVRSALRSGEIAPPYPFEGMEMVDETLLRARERMEEILALPLPHMPKDTVDKVFRQVPGILRRLKNSKTRRVENDRGHNQLN